MGTTVRDIMVKALENLEKRSFKRFKAKLLDIEVEEGYKNISRNKLEDKDSDDIVDLIRKFYKDVYGIEVTLAVLNTINEKKVAEDLEADLENVDGFVRLKQAKESGERTAPTERPLITSLCDNGDMKCSLTLEKLYPRYMQVEWTCGVGESLEPVPSRNHYTEHPDKTFTVCSETRIPGKLLKSPQFTVHVRWDHQYTSSSGKQQLSIRDSDFLWSPVVGEIQTPRLFHNCPATLQCNISGYFPDAVNVKWLLRKEKTQEICEDSDDISIPKIKSNKNADHTYSCLAKLTFTTTLKDHQGAEFICQVEHPALEKPIKKSTGKLSMMAKPQMEPIKMILDNNSMVQFTLNLKMFYPKDIKIRWHRGEKQPRRGVQQVTLHTETITENEDALFDVTSECRILGCSFGDPKYKLYVTWDHESMDEPETRELSARDLPWYPKVESILVLPLLDNEESVLRCTMRGYYPYNITVSWLRKGKGDVPAIPVSSDVTKLVEHEQKRGTTGFSCTALLYFTPTVKEDQGSEFICRVEHPSLEQPIETTTGPLKIRVFCPPQVEDIIIPRLEDKQQVTLTCHATGYFPDGLYLLWCRKENESLTPLAKDRYKFSRFSSYDWDEETYSMEAQLTFTPTLSTDQGVELVCTVKHNSLEQPIERSTGPLLVHSDP